MPHPAPLTAGMRDALERALAHDGIRRVHDQAHGQPAWPAHPASLHALVHRGYLTESSVISRQGNRVDLWQITPEGKAALEQPARLPDGYQRLPDGRIVDRGHGMGRIRDPGAWDGPVLVRKPAPEPERVNRDEYLLRAQRLGRQKWQLARAEHAAALAGLPLKERVENARRLVAESRSAVMRREWQVLDRLVAAGKSEAAVLRRCEAIEDSAIRRAA